MRGELWRPVAGFADLYEVSSSGRVRSLDRVDEAGRRRRGRVLRPSVAPNGRRSVVLARAGRRTTAFVHQLVLTAFVGPRPDGMEGCHNDGDASNNALVNLRWDTRSGNQKDSVRHGTHNMARKTHCPAGHPYDEANTYSNPRGERSCRACHRAHQRAHVARQTTEEKAA